MFRARLLSAPTIVHCMDGCTKSGTLVAIETVLMHFLRGNIDWHSSSYLSLSSGTPLDENVVLLSALFVRLHRHLSVGSPLLYLYIYRCVLHWISPYVASSYQQLALGLQYRSFGFIPTYEELIRGHTIWVLIFLTSTYIFSMFNKVLSLLSLVFILIYSQYCLS